MRIQVLGPLRVWHGDDEIDLGPPGRRAVLGLLVLAGGEPVPRSELMDALWGDGPPASAVNVIQTHVKHLRRLLEPDRPARARSGVLPHRDGGYALRTDAAEADLPRFRCLMAEANAAERDGDPVRVAELLGEAIRLWRGSPLADVPLLAAHPKVAALAAERRAVVARYGEAMIAVGRVADALPALAEAAAELPLDEPTQARLIRAYHALGRRAEAFACYREARLRLAEQLGVDPGPELVAAHAALLRDDDASAGGARMAESARSRVGGRQPLRVPAQLPPDVAAFAGRATQLASLNRLVSGRGEAGAVTLAAISGSAGVGKSALAAHWGHRVRDRFPDGQLYADLRGHASGPPVRPIEVLARFLPALGVPAERVPADLESAAALLRTLLTGRRVLMLLDDAVSPEQVRPLLPGGPGCLVVVTSRERMLGLVARDGAHQVTLEVLSPAESGDLLARLLGPRRAGAEPRATAELAAACAHLPLALRIAAANLVSHAGRRVAEQVAALRADNPLAALEVPGDESTAVRAAFDLSYAALPDDARRVFRLLGLLPGADCDVETAAALVGTEPEAAGELLGRLAAANLVESHAPGRYRFHDLLRHYAVGRARAEDPAAALAAAVRRLHDWYLGATDRAAMLLYPHMLRLPADRGAARFPAALTARAGASGWLDAERGNLVATVRQAAATGPGATAWLLSDALRGYFWLGMHRVDWLATAEAGLAAARADGDDRAQAAARFSLGDLHLRQSQYREAVRHYRHAVLLARRADWSDCHAAVLEHLGGVYWQSGRLPRAVAYFDRALALTRETGQLAGQAVALGNLALVHGERGELAAAAERCGEALELYRRIGSRYGEAINLGNLGRFQHALGLLAEASASLRAALALHREAGDRYGEADTRIFLAGVLRDAGRSAEAQEQARAALALARDIDDPRAEAEALNALATVECRLGRRQEAIRRHRSALELIRASGDRYPECEALVGLTVAGLDPAPARRALALAEEAGYRALVGLARTALAEVALAFGRPAEAAEHARAALAIHRETGRRGSESLTLLALGTALAETEGEAAARPCWQAALRLSLEAGMPEAERLRTLLDGIRTP
ncbi:BTAD domain-containing putative transcriptional regulator [Streptomyces sp. B6B3]|uniref:AfsR/SARP family transcriptional regulator n=1 Tax=Streptomyces sp. B6B3 TaxID=3153570 RepID=UPI00325E04B7